MKGIKLIEGKKLKSKSTFLIELDGTKTNFLAKESFKTGSVRYYPFYTKDGKIQRKYKSIICITVESGVQVKSGISFNESKGFGFTNRKGVTGLFYFFQEKFPKIKEVVISADSESRIDKAKLVLKLTDFEELECQTGVFVESKKNEGGELYQSILNKIFPNNFKVPDKLRYVSGSLHQFILKHSDIKFSNNETEELTKLLLNSGLSQEKLVSTRREIDIVYIEDIVEEFKSNLKQITYTTNLEERWHQFFKKHTWIFSQIFSFPAVFLKDKVNVGGHNILGSKDRIVDFLYKNKITNNIAFIEIKTHLTPLVIGSPYRNNIYPISKELSGAIIQVLDQKNNLLKNYHSEIGTNAESLNSVCVVVVGDTQKFKNNGQSSSFELFRWSNKDVIIIPFNELLLKIENLLDLFKKKTVGES